MSGWLSPMLTWLGVWRAFSRQYHTCYQVVLKIPFLCLSYVLFYIVLLISIHNHIVYAVLKCFKHLNDSIYYKHYRHAASSSWNNYLAFIRQQSPLASALIGCLNIMRYVEVPAELLVKRFSGLPQKYVFTAALESIKYHKKAYNE
jgi:hypothetical protein